MKAVMKMNKKQVVFRLLVIIAFLYAEIYYLWYAGAGSLGVDHVWYISWDEHIKSVLPEMWKFISSALIVMAKWAIVVVCGTGIVVVIHEFDRYLGKKNCRVRDEGGNNES